MIKKVFSIFMFLSIQVHGQNFELEKVTKVELEEKVHPTDSSAVAAILFKKAKTKFNYSQKTGFSVETEFSIKIKIYKKKDLIGLIMKFPIMLDLKTLIKKRLVF